LTCTLIRYQLHLSEVKAAYTEEFGKDLADTIRSELGGDYERILLEVIEA
jgi:hypothetical protein